MELSTPSPTTTPKSDKRFTRRDSDAPEVANLNLNLANLIRPSSVYNNDKKASSRVSFHPVPNNHNDTSYIPRSDPDYGSAGRRSAFRRSKTFWLMMLLALAMCLAVGIGIGYAVGMNGARVVPHTPGEF